MCIYNLEYLFNGEPRQQTLEIEQPSLSIQEAAMHLLQLHFGDAENSLIMPSAQSTPEEVLAQAKLMGLTQIRVTGQPG